MDKVLGITHQGLGSNPLPPPFFEKCLVPEFFHRWSHIQYSLKTCHVPWAPSLIDERHRHLMNTIDATIRQFINSKTPKMGSSVNESILVPTPLWSYWFEYWFEWCTFRRVVNCLNIHFRLWQCENLRADCRDEINLYKSILENNNKTSRHDSHTARTKCTGFFSPPWLL